MTQEQQNKLYNFFSRRAKQLQRPHGNPKVSDDVHPYEPEGGDKSLQSLHDMDKEHEIFFQSLRGGDPTANNT